MIHCIFTRAGSGASSDSAPPETLIHAMQELFTARNTPYKTEINNPVAMAVLDILPSIMGDTPVEWYLDNLQLGDLKALYEKLLAPAKTRLDLALGNSQLDLPAKVAATQEYFIANQEVDRVFRPLIDQLPSLELMNLLKWVRVNFISKKRKSREEFTAIGKAVAAGGGGGSESVSTTEKLFGRLAT